MIKKFFSTIILKDIIEALLLGVKCCFRKPVTRKLNTTKRSPNFRELLSIDDSKCIKCGLCEGVCPNKSIKLPQKGCPGFDPKSCCYCGLCQSACPKKAISLHPKSRQ